MRIEVYGQPQGKQRAKVCMRGGFARAYTPEKTASYEDLINLTYIQALNGKNSPFWEIPVRIKITAFYSIPKSFSKKKTIDGSLLVAADILQGDYRKKFIVFALRTLRIGVIATKYWIF